MKKTLVVLLATMLVGVAAWVQAADGTLDSGFPVASDPGFPVANDSGFPVPNDSGFPVPNDSGFPVPNDPGFPVPSSDPVPVEEPLNACVGVPTLSNVKIGPQKIWAMTEKEVSIDISGTVVVASGCEVNGTYTMDNNGGPVSGNLDIDAAGNFAVKFPIKVTKDPKAKGGTIYNGMLSVVDAVGNKSSQSFVVQVDHDRGK